MTIFSFSHWNIYFQKVCNHSIDTNQMMYIWQINYTNKMQK